MSERANGVTPEMVTAAFHEFRLHVFADTTTCACGYEPITEPDLLWHRLEYVLIALDLPARDARVRADERAKVAAAVLGCVDCGRVHERRDDPYQPDIGTWADPGDGHAYRYPLGLVVGVRPALAKH